MRPSRTQNPQASGALHRRRGRRSPEQHRDRAPGRQHRGGRSAARLALPDSDAESSRRGGTVTIALPLGPAPRRAIATGDLRIARQESSLWRESEVSAVLGQRPLAARKRGPGPLQFASDCAYTRSMKSRGPGPTVPATNSSNMSRCASLAICESRDTCRGKPGFVLALGTRGRLHPAWLPWSGGRQSRPEIRGGYLCRWMRLSWSA